jgi:hypothetical protein
MPASCLFAGDCCNIYDVPNNLNKYYNTGYNNRIMIEFLFAELTAKTAGRFRI